MLTDLARNAEGGTRLLAWAPAPGSPATSTRSATARAAAIEAGARRPAAELAEDGRRTAAAWHEPRLRPAVRLAAPGHLDHRPADAPCRSPRPGWPKCSIHHVDLNRGFGPDSWPANHRPDARPGRASSMNDERHLAPLTATLHATDAGREFRLDRRGGRRRNAPQRQRGGHPWPG